MIYVVTDTVANLAPEEAKGFGIEVIPTYVTFGTQTFRDGIEISSTEFFTRLAASRELPTTSQPSVHDFMALYERIAAGKPDAVILSIHLSAALSGTIESARAAALRLPELNIRIFDTRSLSLGQGFMAIEAARMAKANFSQEEIFDRLAHMRDNLQMYYVLDTLDYLAKGGRIGRAARLLGTMLDMKPILTLKDGVVHPHDRQRSRANAVARLKEMVLEQTKGKKGVYLGVMHGAAQQEARSLQKELEDRIKPDLHLFAEIGPALGTYTGPGTLGVCWYYKE